MKRKMIKRPGAPREHAKVLLRVDRLKDERKTWVQIVQVVAAEGFCRADGKPYTVFKLATLYNYYKSPDRLRNVQPTHERSSRQCE